MAGEPTLISAAGIEGGGFAERPVGVGLVFVVQVAQHQLLAVDAASGVGGLQGYADAGVYSVASRVTGPLRGATWARAISLAGRPGQRPGRRQACLHGAGALRMRVIVRLLGGLEPAPGGRRLRG